ncbi:unnamed protein product [Rhodiola kirilowii]
MYYEYRERLGYRSTKGEKFGHRPSKHVSGPKAITFHKLVLTQLEKVVRSRHDGAAILPEGELMKATREVMGVFELIRPPKSVWIYSYIGAFLAMVLHAKHPECYISETTGSRC